MDAGRNRCSSGGLNCFHSHHAFPVGLRVFHGTIRATSAWETWDRVTGPRCVYLKPREPAGSGLPNSRVRLGGAVATPAGTAPNALTWFLTLEITGYRNIRCLKNM